MNKESAIKATKMLLGQQTSFRAPNPDYIYKIAILQKHDPTFLEMLITSMMIEGIYKGNVNAAKLLLGIYMDDEKSSESS